MGKRGSKQEWHPTLPPKRIFPNPWKNMRAIAPKKELIKDIGQMAPKTRIGLPQLQHYNILLTGQIGSGKSSFFNSINSIFTDRVVQKAEVGSYAHSLTKEFCVYEIKSSTSSKPCNFRIMDTPGLENTTEEDYNEHDVRNILSCVDGNVPDKYEFSFGEEFVPDCRKFIHNPPLKDKAHCVCIVVDASQFTQMGAAVSRKLKSLITGLVNRKLPIKILLTKIDLFGCPSVHYNLENALRSRIILDDCVIPIQKCLAPYESHLEQFLPIKNYATEIELDDSTDVLLLLALDEMLKSCQTFLDTK